MMSLLKSFYNSQYFLIVMITLVIWASLAVFVTWAYNQAHAMTITEKEYKEISDAAQKLSDLGAAMRNEVPQKLSIPDYEQFCYTFEQNSSNHCE